VRADNPQKASIDWTGHGSTAEVRVAMPRSATLLADDVSYRSLRCRPWSTAGDRRRPQAIGRDDWAGDWYSSVGDDDDVAITRLVDPCPEVSSGFGDDDFHERRCT